MLYHLRYRSSNTEVRVCYNTILIAMTTRCGRRRGLSNNVNRWDGGWDAFSTSWRRVDGGKHVLCAKCGEEHEQEMTRGNRNSLMRQWWAESAIIGYLMDHIASHLTLGCSLTSPPEIGLKLRWEGTRSRGCRRAGAARGPILSIMSPSSNYRSPVDGRKEYTTMQYIHTLVI